MTLKFNRTKTIDVSDWDRFVCEHYGKDHYSFQQQNDCIDRGNYSVTVSSTTKDPYENKTIDDMVIKCNHENMGVSFVVWRDTPKDYFTKNNLTIDKDGYNFDGLWWDRNFYPDVEMIARDLFFKGIIDSEDFEIVVDW